ncbi:MAG: hypothetical protein M1833_006731 [Piccolia ochrophora]|nr:MAG: hypothetical protein M1833_006731 [Piccolia ochrophora]
MPSQPPPLEGIKALIFDLMGTCCDWHSSILPVLHSCPASPRLPPQTLPQLAADWRAGFFEEIHRRFEAGEAAEDIDVTHRRVLDRLLTERGVGRDEWGEGTRGGLARRSRRAHETEVEVLHVRTKLRPRRLWKGLLTPRSVVLANGTTRLQLDIIQSSNLPFHTLFSSELLGMTKPDPEIYRRALALLRVAPHESVMVAAHAYDLRAARDVSVQ